MKLTKLFLPFLSLFFILSFAEKEFGVHHDHHRLRQHFKASKLFAFGDSYIDTGNNGPHEYPYGITFPGKPSGRYSNGRVLTDYMASLVGVESPTPYTQLYKAGKEGLKNGVNFGYGGTGVFDTNIHRPNLSNQIDFLEQLIANSTLNPQHISSSLALVSVSGNDYLTYLQNNFTNIPVGVLPFISSVITNLTVDLKRINSLGVKKIVITALGPVECVPFFTSILSFNHCLSLLSPVADYHNKLLKQAVTKLNNNQETTDQPPFFILDLHTAFSYVLNNKGYPKRNITFGAQPLKPCCLELCGSVDGEGKKLYELCEDPNSAFYWDAVHPTQRGWFAAFAYLIDNLKHS